MNSVNRVIVTGGGGIFFANRAAGETMARFGQRQATDRLEVEFVGWGCGDESWSVGYQVLASGVWQPLDELLAQRRRTIAASRCRSRHAASISGFHTQQAYEFACAGSINGSLRARARPGRYLSGQNGRAASTGRCSAPRTWIAPKSTVYRRLKIAPLPRLLPLPGSQPGILRATVVRSPGNDLLTRGTGA
ncbi:MAG: phage terminase large subunit family protein [Bryobacterales bacterium]|nr:phage terminase large subunit family protein [Bryobacterales bacterium]